MTILMATSNDPARPGRHAGSCTPDLAVRRLISAVYVVPRRNMDFAKAIGTAHHHPPLQKKRKGAGSAPASVLAGRILFDQPGIPFAASP